MTDQEIHAKTILIQNKFDYVHNQLRTQVCNAILMLQKQYNHSSKKRRRSLSKKATDVLNTWFFEHINGEKLVLLVIVAYFFESSIF